MDINDNGYQICYRSSDTQSSLSDKAVSAPDVVSEGCVVVLKTPSTTDQKQHWQLTRLPQVLYGVTILESVDELAVGNKYLFTGTMYSTRVGINGQDGFTWSVENGTGSASIDSATGVLTGVSVGTVTVKLTYNYTSFQRYTDSRVVNIIQYSPDLVYQIKNTNTDKFLDAYGFPDGEGDPVCDWEETKQSNQLWSLDHQGNGYYKIYVMSDLDLIIGYDVISGECVTMESSEEGDHVYWKIESTGANTVKIVSKYQYDANPKCLTNNTNLLRNYTTCSNYNATHSQWIITEFTNDTYWDGEYTTVDNMRNIAFTVEPTVFGYSTYDLEEIISIAGERWNGISSEINIKYIPIEYIDICDKTLIATLRVTSEMDNEKGIMLPILNGEEYTPSESGNYPVGFTSQDWDGAIVYVRSDMLDLTPDDSMNYQEKAARLQSVISHEMGHVLKLCHCREREEAENSIRQPAYKSTYPANMQPITASSGDDHIYASKYGFSCWWLTEFDKSALIAKWGK